MTVRAGDLLAEGRRIPGVAGASVISPDWAPPSPPSMAVLAGATSAGPAGGEVLSMLTLAVHAAVPVQRLREMIYAFPTFHGAVPEAIGRLS
jgi:hypothetical protein